MTVASLIAFAGLHAYIAMVGVDVLSHWDLVTGHTSVSRGDIYICELLAVIFGLALLWGGFAAWRGLDRKALFVTALGVLSPHIFHAVVDGAWRAVLVPHVYDVALLIAVLLAIPPSRDYFRTRIDDDA